MPSYRDHSRSRKSSSKRRSHRRDDSSSDSADSIVSSATAFSFGDLDQHDKHGPYGKQKFSSMKTGKHHSDAYSSDSDESINSNLSGRTAFSGDTSYGTYKFPDRDRRSSSKRAHRSSGHKLPKRDDFTSNGWSDDNAYRHAYPNHRGYNNYPSGKYPSGKYPRREHGSDSDNSATSMGNNYDSDDIGGRTSRKYRQKRSQSLPSYYAGDSRNDRRDRLPDYRGSDPFQQYNSSVRGRDVGSRLDNLGRKSQLGGRHRRGESSGSDSSLDQGIGEGFDPVYGLPRKSHGRKYGGHTRHGNRRMPGAFESDSNGSSDSNQLDIERVAYGKRKSHKNRSSHDRYPGQDYGLHGGPQSSPLPPLNGHQAQFGNAGFPGQSGLPMQGNFNPLPDYSFEDGAVRFQNRFSSTNDSDSSENSVDFDDRRRHTKYRRDDRDRLRRNAGDRRSHKRRVRESRNRHQEREDERDYSRHSRSHSRSKSASRHKRDERKTFTA